MELAKQRKEKKCRAYIEQNISKGRGKFVARTETLKHAIQRSFAVWHTHTHADLFMLLQTVKQAGTLPFMQLQGLSNHCGVCAINNVAGQEVTNVPEAADELWLKQFEKTGCLVTDDIQRHRDSNGFHSLKTLEI